MSTCNDNCFSKEYAPGFILEDKYYLQLNTANQIALYSFVARNAYRGVPFHKIDFLGFCEHIGVEEEEIKSIIDRFYEIGFITERN